MHDEDRFFMRDPWVYNPGAAAAVRPDKDQGFETRALHAGFHPAQDLAPFRSFVPPITQSMTFPYENFDRIPCPVYGRTRTPTNTILEERLASLEGGEACLTAGSGSQALFNLIFTIARPGDNVVTSLNVFGEGYKQAAAIFPERCGVEFRFVADPGDASAWDVQIDGRTRLAWVETPSNPCLFITDIAAVADVAHSRGVPLMVDNTTATAALQQPTALGADIVLLSVTKFDRICRLGHAAAGCMAFAAIPRNVVLEDGAPQCKCAPDRALSFGSPEGETCQLLRFVGSSPA
jgi:O-acetylhomoserine/O-acetylserine sulfhydrylase-like pyridoxal-dependent enzyme